MSRRLEQIEVIKLDPKYSHAEVQAFIEQWNLDNPEKFNDESFMPLFSPFIEKCSLVKSEDVTVEQDILTVTMLVTPDNWPGRQEVADITFFVTSLKNNYDHLNVKMIFEVVWNQ